MPDVPHRPTCGGPVPVEPAAAQPQEQSRDEPGFSRGESAAHLARVALHSLMGVLFFPAIALRVLLENGLPRRGPLSRPGRCGQLGLGSRRSSVLSTILAFLPDLAVYVAELFPRRALLRYRYPRSFTDCAVQVGGGTQIACTVGAHMDPDIRPTLILLPGMFNTRSQRILVSLAVRAHAAWGFHVVVADMRGFGDTARLGASVTSVSLLEADDVVALARWARKHLPTDAVYAVGFSFGGVVTLGAASQARAGELTACVAFCPYADLREMIDWLSEPLLLDRSLPFNIFYRYLLWRLCRLRGLKGVHNFRAYIQRVVSAHLGLSEDEVYERTSPVGYVRDLAVPTLIVHAEDDPVIPVENAYRLEGTAGAQSNSMLDVVTVPRGGHFANWLVAGKATEALVLSFLRSRPAVGPDGRRQSTKSRSSL